MSEFNKESWVNELATKIQLLGSTSFRAGRDYETNPPQKNEDGWTTLGEMESTFSRQAHAERKAAEEALLLHLALHPTLNPCSDGCSYAKDVGMIEHSCADGCVYAKHLRF